MAVAGIEPRTTRRFAVVVHLRRLRKILRRLRKIWYATVLVPCLVLIATQSALGQGTDAQRQACMSDVFRLCNAYIPNVDPIVACLKRNRANLSPVCLQTLTPSRARRARRAGL